MGDLKLAGKMERLELFRAARQPAAGEVDGAAAGAAAGEPAGAPGGRLFGADRDRAAAPATSGITLKFRSRSILLLIISSDDLFSENINFLISSADTARRLRSANGEGRLRNDMVPPAHHVIVKRISRHLRETARTRLPRI